MINFMSFSGTVNLISNFIVDASDKMSGCYKLISLTNNEGAQVNFVVSPTTYFVDHAMITVGDRITGFFDGNAPAPLIYPPQYQAIVMARDTNYQFVKVDYFDRQLLSSDGQLKLNVSNYTPKLLTNDQSFTLSPANRNLVVVYGPTTMSIPAQTTPYKIIVLC